MRFHLEMWPDHIRYRTIDRLEVAGEQEVRRGERLPEASIDEDAEQHRQLLVGDYC
jgi:hypothetical protein